METRFVLMIACGCPCTGKTYFTAKFKQYLEATDVNFNFIKISFDNVIDSRLERLIIKKDFWKESRLLVQSLVKLLIDYLKTNPPGCSFDVFLNERNLQENANNREITEEIYSSFLMELNPQLVTPLKENYVICLDDNMYYESMRLKYFQLARHQICSYYCLCFKIRSLEKLLELNKNRVPSSQDFKITDTIIENMFSKFNYPDSVKWEKDFCSILEYNENLAEEIHFDKVFADLVETATRLFSSCNINQTILDKNHQPSRDSNFNIKHQSDLILRRLVKERIEGGDLSCKKEVAIRCNKAKSDILSKLSRKTDDLYVKLDELFKEDLVVYESYLSSCFLEQIN